MRIKGYSFAEVAEALGLTEEEVRNEVNSKKRIPVCDENGNARLYDGNGKEINYET